MKYYISCAQTDHGKIRALHSELEKIGHICVYKWWDSNITKRKESFEVSFERVQAIENTELFICLMPLTRNTSIELGISLASRYGKRIILWSLDDAAFAPIYSNLFFDHPSVSRMSCSFQELIQYVKTL